MAVSMTIDLEGYDALTKAFNALPLKLQSRFLRPALRDGAKVMLKAVQRNAPRSDEAPHMDATLKIKAMKRKRGRVGFVVITGRRDALGIKKKDTYYPAHIEYGYRKPDGTRVAANPWMKRGLEDGRAEATETIAQSLSRRLKESVGLESLSDAEGFGGPDVEVTV